MSQTLGWLLFKKIHKRTSVSKDVRRWWECKMVQQLWKQLGDSPKSETQNDHMIQYLYFWVHPQKKWKQELKQIFVYRTSQLN